MWQQICRLVERTSNDRLPLDFVTINIKRQNTSVKSQLYVNWRENSSPKQVNDFRLQFIIGDYMGGAISLVPTCSIKIMLYMKLKLELELSIFSKMTHLKNKTDGSHTLGVCVSLISNFLRIIAVSCCGIQLFLNCLHFTEVYCKFVYCIFMSIFYIYKSTVNSCIHALIYCKS
jgi:hypothetical protein